MTRSILGLLAAGATALTAYAQPATYTDLGTHTSPEVLSTAVTLTAANNIQWFRIELPANSSTDGWVDIWTLAPGDITDSEIGIYDNAGNIVGGSTALGSDDDSGPGLLSQLSYGQTTPARPANGTGAVRAGQDGTLGGGVYWVAVGHFNVTFGLTGWTVTSAYTGTQRTITLTFDIQPAGSPTNPAGIGAATPNNGVAGASFVATVTVTPGANPPSTGLAVSLDASAVGGGTVALLDDGNPPDAAAGDNIFTGDVTTGGSTAPAAYSLPFAITDAELRTGNGSIAYTVNPTPDWDEALDGGGDAGQTASTAQTVGGSGALNSIAGNLVAGDADVFLINICDPANFSASTNNANTSATDTQLFVFDSNGIGVVMNDDDPAGGLRSRISNAIVGSYPAGNYYLAVSRYDTDPIDASAQEIWLDTPFNVERAPDGAGAANPWDTFNGAATATGSYWIDLTGACFVGGGNPCPCDGDLNGDGLIDITDLALFLSSFGTAAPGIPTPCADINGDGLVDISDLALFLSAFGSTCP
ncbi:MAG: hypothetical protein HZB38_12560 [Planctomycetes bacterium]|nr:hypothetical protein [Planctomycetota bacterium]